MDLMKVNVNYNYKTNINKTNDVLMKYLKQRYSCIDQRYSKW